MKSFLFDILSGSSSCIFQAWRVLRVTERATTEHTGYVVLMPSAPTQAALNILLRPVLYVRISLTEQRTLKTLRLLSKLTRDF